VDPKTLKRALLNACKALAAAEPDLTRWDTEMGDGDCGLTLETGAKALMASVNDDGLADSGSVIRVLHEVESIVEGKMGGTLGGILGIFFVGLTTALCKGRAGGAGEGHDLIPMWAEAVDTAVENLSRYTPATIGSRTVMDVLIPFGEALRKEGSFEAAVREARRAAESTRKMQAKLGRATYVGTEGKSELPPDPGAWGAMVVLEGLAEGIKG